MNMQHLRKWIIILFSIFLVIILPLNLLHKVKADAPYEFGPSWSGSTPVIDGEIVGDEWENATICNFSINHGGILGGFPWIAGPETHNGSIYIMNDEFNLYITVQLYGEDYNASSGAYDELAIYFDGNNNGIIDDPEDLKLISTFNGYGDWNFNLLGSNVDTELNGSGDVDHTNPSEGAIGNYTFEFSIPLDSGDSEDIAISGGSITSFTVSYTEWVEDPGNPGSYAAIPGYWPAAKNQPEDFLDIKVASKDPLIKIESLDCASYIDYFEIFQVNLSILNWGAQDATGVNATIVLPPELYLYSGTETINIGTLNRLEDITVSWFVRAADNGTHSITVDINSENGGLDTDSINTEVRPPPILKINNFTTPNTGKVGEIFSVFINVTNIGNDTAKNVNASIILPPDLSLFSGNLSQNLGNIARLEFNNASWLVSANNNGTFTINIKVNSSNNCVELNNTNIRIYSLPNLSLSTPLYPSILTEKNSYKISVNLTNLGELAAFFTQASLILPSGIKIASGTNNQNLGNIGPGNTVEINWYVAASSDGHFNISLVANSINGTQSTVNITLIANDIPKIFYNFLPMTINLGDYLIIPFKISDNESISKVTIFLKSPKNEIIPIAFPTSNNFGILLLDSEWLETGSWEIYFLVEDVYGTKNSLFPIFVEIVNPVETFLIIFAIGLIASSVTLLGYSVYYKKKKGNWPKLTGRVGKFFKNFASGSKGKILSLSKSVSEKSSSVSKSLSKKIKSDKPIRKEIGYLKEPQEIEKKVDQELLNTLNNMSNEEVKDFISNFLEDLKASSIPDQSCIVSAENWVEKVKNYALSKLTFVDLKELTYEISIWEESLKNAKNNNN